jgi:hypothetical protein
MIRTRRSKSSLARRLYTALAVLVLLFAATVAPVTHSIAMPMMAMLAPAGHDMTMHDHGCDPAAGVPDEQPALPSAPCDNGCLLCNNCSLASAVMPAHPVLAETVSHPDYRVVTALLPTGITPTPPNEPPRL